MRVLICIPHVFYPTPGSVYSSELESKRSAKEKAVHLATVQNVRRHNQGAYIHASLGKGKPIVTRRLQSIGNLDLEIQVYTLKGKSLITDNMLKEEGVKTFEVKGIAKRELPLLASRRALEQAEDYDLVCYMEDDISIVDRDLFEKISFLVSKSGDGFTFVPHRCEEVQGIGDVILSGDPDGGRDDLFWATGEELNECWNGSVVRFYRATNPHSGCYFLTRKQALSVRSYWSEKAWRFDFVLSGPMEQAASGLLLPVLKVMKTRPEYYRFLAVYHEDELWRRHPFE